jgi:hypothetical protein
MSEKPTPGENLPGEKQKIVVGSPLPFSVFGAEGQLLLAEGAVVGSDHTRRMLLLKGVYHDSIEEEALPEENRGAAESTPQAPLPALRRDYGAASVGRRFALTIAAPDGDENYSAWVIGVHDRSIIVTAPRRTNGALVTFKLGQACVCRAFQMTSAFRFRSTVTRVIFEPFPHLHIEAPQHVERRTVRNRPRAAVFVDVIIEAPSPTAAVIVDLSASGGRLAVEEGVNFLRGHGLRIGMKIQLIDSTFDLTLKANVVRVFGVSDGRHPKVHFYGIRFEGLSELERLVLHGYVSGELALELNSLWQLLSSAAPSGSEPSGKT